MKKIGWFFLWVLSYIIHGLWIVPAIAFIYFVLRIETEWLIGAVLIISWVVAVLFSGGCPFAYLHEYLEIKLGWRKEKTYQFKDCVLSRYVIEPLRKLLFPAS